MCIQICIQTNYGKLYIIARSSVYFNGHSYISIYVNMLFSTNNIGE